MEEWDGVVVGYFCCGRVDDVNWSMRYFVCIRMSVLCVCEKDDEFDFNWYGFVIEFYWGMNFLLV